MPRSRVVNRVVSIDSSSRSPEIFQSTDESCHLSIEIPCSFACRAVGSSIESPQSIRRVGLQKFSSRLVGPVIEELFDLIADCWRHEIIPDGMSVGVQILLWKRKKALERFRNFMHATTFQKFSRLHATPTLPKNSLVNGEASINCPYSTGSDTSTGCLGTSTL